MKQKLEWVKPVGTVRCKLPTGEIIKVPVVPGVLKHPTVAELKQLLKNPDVVRKYTLEALRVAPWSALKCFPPAWLLQCLPSARVREGRALALRYLLS